MANSVDPRTGFAPQTADTASYDAGLRSYMLSIYNYMASGVLLTGVVALLLASNPAIRDLFYSVNVQGRQTATGLGLIAMLSPLAIVLVMNFGANRLSEGTLRLTFFAFAALMGVSMSTIFFIYTGASITMTFFAAAASYGALSIYGYTTKRDLSGMGAFLFMALIGLLIAMVIAMFTASSGLIAVISFAGVLIFAGLTAYKTQMLKSLYFEAGSSEAAGKYAVLGALSLYLSFINMFRFMLMIMGNRR